MKAWKLAASIRL